MITTETYGAILEIAEAFEDSVTRALHQSKNTSEEDKGEDIQREWWKHQNARQNKPWPIKIEDKEGAEVADTMR